MSVRIRTLVAVAVAVSAIGAWFWWRARPAPVQQQAVHSAETVRAPVTAANKPIAQATATTAADEPACIPATATSKDRSEETWKAQVTASRGPLLASRDPEYLAAAALMATPDDRVALITPAWADSDIPVVAWAAAQICAAAPDEKACPADELVERLPVIDPLNSESWMFAAVRRFNRGDTAGALIAVQRAGTAPESRAYWAETIALVDRALAATSDYPFDQRVIAAIGTAAAMPKPNIGGYSRMCATQSQASRTWAFACLRYGEQAEKHSDTILGEMIGRSVQIVALQHLNDPEKLAAAVARRDLANQEMKDDARLNGEADELMWSTPRFIADYLNVLAQQGESAALRWKRTEAARLRAELPPCASL